MKKQRGYTLIELLICIIFFVAFALGGTVLYVAWHFISKYW